MQKVRYLEHEDIQTSQLNVVPQQHVSAHQLHRNQLNCSVAERTPKTGMLENLEIAHLIPEAVFTRMSDGLLLLDDTLTILQVNPAFCQWIGLPATAITGQFITNVLVCDQIVPALHNRTNDATAPERVELTVTLPTRRSLLAQFSQLKTDRMRGWVIVLHDQSERQRVDYQKLEFINIAAHELRTPLMVIMGFTNILLKDLADHINQQELDFLQAILDSSQRLKSIINEMVSFANLNQGHLPSQGVSDLSVAELIHDVADEMQQQALDRKITLNVAPVDPDIPPFADTTLLRIALNQLVLNAITFNTPGGSAQITTTHDHERINIEIADTGIGIPPSDREAIFQPFFQVEDHHTRRVGGMGLGLSIAKRAIVQLSGTLTVESTFGSGTICTIQLPLQSSAPDNELATLQSKLVSSQRQSRTYAHDIQVLYQQLQQHTLATLNTITEVLEARDSYFRSHTDRVTALALRIAQKIGFSALELRTLEIAGRIHDIGKLGVPETILNKTEQLTADEEALMRHHVALGRSIVQPLAFLQTAAPMAFSHHERWDDRGYPDGLAGDAIPLGGRILAVADAYDALVSPRSYRVAHTHEQAIAIMRAGMGSQWDAHVVTALLELMDMVV